MPFAYTIVHSWNHFILKISTNFTSNYPSSMLNWWLPASNINKRLDEGSCHLAGCQVNTTYQSQPLIFPRSLVRFSLQAMQE